MPSIRYSGIFISEFPNWTTKDNLNFMYRYKAKNIGSNWTLAFYIDISKLLAFWRTLKQPLIFLNR